MRSGSPAGPLPSMTRSTIGAGRPGWGTADQIREDLEQLRRLGAETVLLDPFDGDPRETLRPQEAWRALATVAALRP